MGDDSRDERHSQVIEQTFSGLPAVKAFGREQMNEELLRKTTGHTLNAVVSSLKVQLQFKILMDLAIALGTACIFWIGAQSVLAGEMTVGAIVLFLSYLAAFYAPLAAIMYTGSATQAAAGSARRIHEIISASPEVIDKPHAVPLRQVRGLIRFEGVSFCYEQQREVLHDISFEVEPGHRIALVGPSGAGKTGLVSTALRLFSDCRLRNRMSFPAARSTSVITKANSG